MFAKAVVALIVLVAVLSLFVGCAASGGSRSARGQMGTRELSATVTGAGELSVEVNPLTNSGIVIVNKHKVLLDGERIMTLSPQSKKVEVTYKGGRLTVSDGAGSAHNQRL
jgi:ABC-type phosphate transport system substrate-binding protein